MGESEELSLIPTKCSALKRDAADNFQVVVHNHAKKTAVKRTVEEEKTKNPKMDREEIDMKKARFEIYKFATADLKGKQKRKAKMDLAIQLGAKAPRNRRYNYKNYKALKEKEKRKQLEEQRMRSAGKDEKGKPMKTPHEKTNIRKDGILAHYGKPGKVRIRKKKRRKY